MAEKRDAKRTEMTESLGLRNLGVTVDIGDALLMFGHSFKVQFLERIKKVCTALNDDDTRGAKQSLKKGLRRS